MYYSTEEWDFFPKSHLIVYKNGSEHTLQKRISLCLELLLESHQTVITYDELLLKVWKTEHREASTISSSISELRKIIGCSKGQKQKIKTISKRGYQFVGIFEKKEFEETNTSRLDLPTSEPDQKSNIIEFLIYLFPKKLKVELTQVYFLILVAFVLFFYQILQSNEFETVLHLQGQQQIGELEKYSESQLFITSEETLTFDKGIETDFDISPDSSQLVYVSQESELDNSKLKLKNLETGQIFILNPNVSSSLSSPSFSNDGKLITFIENSAIECSVKVISVSAEGFNGNSLKKITSCGLPGGWSTPIFSIDDTGLFFSYSEDLNKPYKIMYHDLLDGTEEVITAPSSNGRGDYSMSLSPDGQKLAIVRNDNWRTTRIILFNLVSRNSVELVHLNALLYKVDWENGDHLLYKKDASSLSRLHIETATEVEVYTDLTNVNFPTTNKETLYGYTGHKILTEILKVQFDNSGVDIEPLLDESSSSSKPVLAGEKLFFISNRDGKKRFWVKDKESISKLSGIGTTQNQKLLKINEKSNVLWKLEGKKLFKVYSETLLQEEYWEFESSPWNSSISVDGKYLLYANQQNGRWYINQFNIESKEVSRLGKGFTGKMIEDSLFYFDFKQSGLRKKNLITMEETVFLEDIHILDSDLWAISENEIVYATETSLVKQNINDPFSKITWDSKGIRQLACKRDLTICFVEGSRFGSTKIVKLKKNKDFSTFFQN